jgi:glycyl-tRNA synthetase beta chain
MKPRGEFLLELRSEEIPARMQAEAEERLKVGLAQALGQVPLAHTSIQPFSTPRRLGCVIQGLASEKPAEELVKKGPRIDAPKVAFEGFLKSQGVNKDQCYKEETPKGTFWMAKIQSPAQKTSDLLPLLIDRVLRSFFWPKTMRWGSNTFRWVRPLRGLSCLWEGQVLPMNFDLGSECLQACSHTYGHRNWGREPLPISSWQNYQETLLGAGVVIGRMDRCERILEQTEACLANLGLCLLPEDVAPGGLIDEVIGLVEWPYVVRIAMPPEVQALPDEVTTTVLHAHQRCFPLKETRTGKIALTFLTVANMIPADGGEAIRQGNERVVLARLKDALFFLREDQSHPLEYWREKLKNRLFFNELGTIYQKTERLAHLAQTVFPDQARDLVKAAELSKADLVTHMVGEFPELQGTMGAYYGGKEGLSPSLTEAIRDHYAPLNEEDVALLEKRSLLGLRLGLLDRIDTLVGLFALQKKPTGSKDPLALRRAALGVVHILMHLPALDLELIIDAAYGAYQAQQLLKAGRTTLSCEATKDALKLFLRERLAYVLRQEGGEYDVILFALSCPYVSLFEIRRLMDYARMMKTFMRTQGGQSFREMAHRVAEILVARKEPGECDRVVDPKNFVEPQEKELWHQMQQLRPLEPGEVLTVQHLQNCLILKPFLDKFLDHVTVYAKDLPLRRNRLALLGCLHKHLNVFGHIQHVEKKNACGSIS